jgi:hypothetical protein
MRSERIAVEMPVVIEPIAGRGYRATGAGELSVGLSADGATAAEAIDRLAERFRRRVDSGASLTELNVAGDPAPWKQDAGYLRDDPLYEPWRAETEQYRRLDGDPDASLACLMSIPITCGRLSPPSESLLQTRRRNSDFDQYSLRLAL